MELDSKLILISLMMILMESNPTLRDMPKLEWRFILLRLMLDAANSAMPHARSLAHGQLPTWPLKPRFTENCSTFA